MLMVASQSPKGPSDIQDGVWGKMLIQYHFGLFGPLAPPSFIDGELDSITTAPEMLVEWEPSIENQVCASLPPAFVSSTRHGGPRLSTNSQPISFILLIHYVI